jgi:flavin-dependent dehydrogenase
MNGNIKSVAIIGGGPAASTLATLLARKNIRTAIFYIPKHLPLTVGESLVPGVVEFIRLLGVEDEVRSFSMFKPGATVNLGERVDFHIKFGDIRGPMPRYAYNVPRDKFDETVLGAARKAGVKIFELAANIEKIPGTDKVKLSDDTLAATENYFDGQPDMIVDATGRLRLLPKLLGIGAREGGRKDTAIFAHLDKAHLDQAGHIHTTRLDRGWSWRIPLPGRVSVGIVIDSQHLPQFGATKEERYDNLLKQDSVLAEVTKGSTRLTPVVEHLNYQLVSERLYGENWALVGDTAGFIDPVFSSGLFLSMQGATWLAKTIINGGSERAFKKYQHDCLHHLGCWQEIIKGFYNGRLFNTIYFGEKMEKKYWWIRAMSPWYRNHFGKIFSGALSNSDFSIGMMRWVADYSAKRENHELLRIR